MPLIQDTLPSLNKYTHMSLHHRLDVTKRLFDTKNIL